MKQLLSLLLVFIFHVTIHISEVATQTTLSPAPAPPAPRNISRILKKAGHFTTFNRLLKSTYEADQINTILNSTSNQGLTVFAPTDNAFSNLPAGTLNSLSDPEKIQLVQFHILPSFVSPSQFKTVTNPVRTKVGDADNGKFKLNVSTSGNQVNVSTGVVTAAVSNTIYSDGQIVIYLVDDVLLPLALFGIAPAPSPVDDVAKPKPSDTSTVTGSDDDASVDRTSNAFTAMKGHAEGVAVLSFMIGVVAFILAF